MNEKLVELISKLEPDVRELVAEVIELEREHLDQVKPHGIREEIRDRVDKYARHGMGSSEAGS